MGYDSVRGEVVLFGGYNNWNLNDGRGYFRQTWTWDGSEWRAAVQRWRQR